LIIEDGDYQLGMQVGIISTESFISSKMVNETIVAISDAIGNTSFKNKSKVHEQIQSMYKGFQLAF